jgi:hypothetical protein
MTAAKSPPFEGGEAAPAKRERGSAKHQEKAQTGWLLQAKDHLNHPACSRGSQAPLLQKEGIFAGFQFVHSFIDRPYC